MIRCTKCCMPSTRPDHVFVDGICPACINHDNKPSIDWESREKELIALLDRHDGRCIVPSSGGKDSTYQVIKLKELGADVTVVTASTCYLTPLGRKNIDNLAYHARTIEYSPNKSVRAKLNRLGLEYVGDISWPEHAAIFSTPFRAALETNIPLIFYGENPQDQYGGPVGSEQAMTMTRRWTQEFGGFLGLRPTDFIGVEGITKRDMDDYEVPESLWSDEMYTRIEAHFLGQYIPWDSRRNAEVAIANGMEARLPSQANWWIAENLDNAMTGIHDHSMYRKYGYGRGATQIAVDVRNGLVTTEQALNWIEKHDGLFPYHYDGVPIGAVLDQIEMSEKDFLTQLDNYTNTDLFDGVEDYRPILKC